MIGIVGAGLAGLACAQELHRQGREFVLFEATGEVGGRVKSETRDGFVLDRGFQVLLTSYPAIARSVEVPKLEPRYFESGALLAYEGKTASLFHPIFHPEKIGELVKTDAISWMDRLRLGCVVAGVVLTGDHELLRRCRAANDRSLRDLLESERWSGPLRERFVEPFFGGVLLDDELKTSAALFLYYLKKFALGRAWIPARGIGAFPKAIAEKIPEECLRRNVPVTGWETSLDRVTTLLFENGRRETVDSVILALDAPARSRLLSQPPPTMRSVAVVYLESDGPVYPGAHLVLPAGSGRVVRHFVQMSNVAPELAPPGRHFLSATVLHPGLRSDEELFQAVIAEIRSVFPEAKLQPLAVQRVANALPEQPPGFGRTGFRSPWRNVFVVGDGIRGASIQNALESGREAAFLCA